MNKWLITASLLIVAGACEPRPDMAAPDGMRRLAPRAQLLDPTLQTALATAGSTDSLVVIVNYDATATSRDAVTSAILGTGAGVIQFKHLALVAALATPSQITQIAGLSGIRSIYSNRRLWYYGLPFSGLLLIRVFVRNQGCCGAMQEHLGLDGVNELRDHNRQAFRSLDVAAVVCNSSGCGLALGKALNEISEFLLLAALRLQPN